MSKKDENKSFVPFEKLSKKEKQSLNAKRRKTWNGLNPVTRKPENPKAYHRSKARRTKEDDSFTAEPFTLSCYAKLF